VYWRVLHRGKSSRIAAFFDGGDWVCERLMEFVGDLFVWGVRDGAVRSALPLTVREYLIWYLSLVRK
jgi:hypothetical protein